MLRSALAECRPLSVCQRDLDCGSSRQIADFLMLTDVGGHDLHDALQKAVEGRYWIEGEIARGGMGAVFLARDLALERPVAIKVLLPDRASPALRERFLREARVAAGLSHPHVVPIHSVEQHDDLVLFIMAYVDGETLRQRVERLGPLNAAESTRVVQEIAWALSHAHERGIVHRDIKPDNVLIERASGRVLVTDFGIAHAASADSMTNTGERMGTPHYLSPEQAAGDAVDGRSDLYSLGATAFFAVTGHPPFEAPSATSLLWKHMFEPAPGVANVRPDLPPKLVEAIDRCLQKEPASRVATADVLARELGIALSATNEIPQPLARVVNAADQLAIDLAGSAALIVTSLLLWRPPGGEESVVFVVVDFEAVIALFLAAIGFGLAVVRVGDFIGDVRAALKAGYGDHQIRAAFRRSAGAGSTPRADHGWRTWAALAAATAVLAFYWLAGRRMVADLATIADLPVLLTTLFVARKVVKTSLAGGGTSAWHRLWAGPVGRRLLRFAGMGYKHRAAPAGAAQPTEVLIGNAVSELFGMLPPEFRGNLPDLLPLVERLEHHAEALRQRRNEIDAAITQAGTDSLAHRRGGSSTAGSDIDARLRTRTEAAINALRERHGAIISQLATVLSALETIRLDLLSVRAGTATAQDLTADLEFALQVGREVDAMLAVHREVERSGDVSAPVTVR